MISEKLYNRRVAFMHRIRRERRLLWFVSGASSKFTIWKYREKTYYKKGWLKWFQNFGN